MKRYLSVDHIYVELLADYCGESYFTNNSWNLRKAAELHNLGYSWKAIYFGFLEYSNWYDKEWDKKFDKGDWIGREQKMFFGQNAFDKDGDILIKHVETATAHLDDYMTAEEFYFYNMPN